MQANHSLNYGGDATLSGSYYDPNFLNFTINPYYNQSKADSNFQSLTDSSGVIANANFFTGSHYPGYVSYDYTRNSTGTLGFTGIPNFTTVSTGYGFGAGWRLLLPDKPTVSGGYSLGSGSGQILGTNEECSSANRTLH